LYILSKTIDIIENTDTASDRNEITIQFYNKTKWNKSYNC